MTPPRSSLWLHLVALAFLAIAVGVLAVQEPPLGDDLGYWNTAYELRSVPGSSLGEGFHELRWPVWGVCWLLQGVVGPTLASYYGEPILYLILGAWLVFLVARRVLGTLGGAWVAGVVFLFHPLLDPAITRPMPDLSEGFWAAAAVVAWFAAMVSEKRSRTALAALACGVCIGIGFANRITGVLIVPSLVVMTLVWYPRRFGWLVLGGVAALAVVGLEAANYARLFDDPLHALNANLKARGRRGTESQALWQLPFRFFDSLWSGNLLKVPLNLLALLGAVALWRSREREQRMPVGWAVLYFLTFSCMLQSVSPPRPLVRDGDRFLAAMAFPLALWVAAGAQAVATSRWATGGGWLARVVGALRRRPVLAVLGAVVVLAAVSARNWFDLGFVPVLRERLASAPAGAGVVGDGRMRQVARLMDPAKAESFRWFLPKTLLEQGWETTPEGLASDHVWLNRKLAWVTPRKALEKQADREPLRLAGVFARPAEGWWLEQVLERDGIPDFAFYRRALPTDPAPVVLTSDAALPAGWEKLKTPLEWRKGQTKTWKFGPVPLPETWRGRLLHVALTLSADESEPVDVTLIFYRGGREIDRSLWSPYAGSKPTPDFLHVAIPKDADAVLFAVNVDSGTKQLTLHDWRVTLFDEGSPLTVKAK